MKVGLVLEMTHCCNNYRYDFTLKSIGKIYRKNFLLKHVIDFIPKKA
jgi:hypothetical protein